MYVSISTVYRIYVNLLKPIGYVMHHQFNIQQLYALPTLYLWVLFLSENKQRLVPLTA
jgi:energy-converting hydrogenase Eha subunit F